MNRTRLTAALLTILLFSVSCAQTGKTEPLRPDTPAASGGVGRYAGGVESETDTLSSNDGDPDRTGSGSLTVTPADSGSSGTGTKNWTSSAGIPADAGSAGSSAQAQNPGGSGSAQTSTAQNTGSLAPFGAFDWWKEGSVYKYNFPARNDSGMASINEMYSFPTTRFEDANKPPDKDNWFPGQATYDESTGEVIYGWDRWKSTKETMAKYGAIYRGDETRKVCYLTFDCGYEYGATEKILDALRDKQAPGAFMLTGPYVRTQHDLIERMLNEGHIVGNHTNNHLDMTFLTVDEVIDEMRTVEEDFKAQFPDAPDMIYFRPPAGAVNEWLLRIEAKLGYRTMVWSYTYKDYIVYEQWDYDDALNILKEHLHPGCVYLLHAESSTNAEILPEFIDWIRSQGYEIEPICAIGA